MRVNLFGPLLTKELRTRMRGSAVFVIENLYLLLLGGVSAAILIKNLEPDALAWQAGREIFATVSGIQVTLLWILSAVVAASAVTQEKEQKTYDLLVSTPITPAQLVFNKLAASISYFVVLALLGLPLVSMGFILGGVSFGQILQVEVITLVALVSAGALGVCLSTFFSRSVSAVPVAATAIILIMVLSDAMSDTAVTAFSFNPRVAYGQVAGSAGLRFYAFSLPVWVPFIVLTAASSAALLAHAALRVTPFFKRDHLKSSLLSLGAGTVFLWALAGSSLYTPLDLEDSPGTLAETTSLVFQVLLVITFFLALVRPEHAALAIWSERRPRPWLRLRGWVGGQAASAPRFLFVLGLIAGAGVLVGWMGMEGVVPVLPGGLVVLAVFALAPAALCLLSRLPMLWPATNRARWGARRAGAAAIFISALGALPLSHYLAAQVVGPQSANPLDRVMVLSAGGILNAATHPVAFFDHFPGLVPLEGSLLLPGVHLLFLATALAGLGLVNAFLVRRLVRARTGSAGETARTACLPPLPQF